jgi:hypothetical protein
MKWVGLLNRENRKLCDVKKKKREEQRDDVF